MPSAIKNLGKNKCRNRLRYWKRIKKLQYVMGVEGRLAILGYYCKYDMGMSVRNLVGFINIGVEYCSIQQTEVVIFKYEYVYLFFV